MTLALFWLACAGLVALAGLMLAAATRPRMPGAAESTAGSANLMVLKQQLADLNAELAEGRIDVEEHGLARGEMECRVIEEQRFCATSRPAPAAMPRRTIALLTLAAAAAASGLYALLGNTAGLSPPVAAAAAGPDTDSRAVEAMLDDMAQRMSSQPPQSTDAAGWAFLGRSYAAVHRFESASNAYARAITQSPDDAQLLVDRADVLSMLQGRRTDGEPRRLIERALQLDPANLKALALAGSDAFERKDFAAALAHWSKARQLAPAGAFADNMARGIADARAALGGAPNAAAVTPSDPRRVQPPP